MKCHRGGLFAIVDSRRAANSLLFFEAISIRFQQ